MLPAHSSNSESCTKIGPQPRCGYQRYAAMGSGSCSGAMSTHRSVQRSRRRVRSRCCCVRYASASTTTSMAPPLSDERRRACRRRVEVAIVIAPMSGRSEALRRRPDHAVRAAFARRLRDEELQLVHAGVDVHLFEPRRRRTERPWDQPGRPVTHGSGRAPRLHGHRRPDRSLTHGSPPRYRPINPSSSDATRSLTPERVRPCRGYPGANRPGRALPAAVLLHAPSPSPAPGTDGARVGRRRVSNGFSDEENCTASSTPKGFPGRGPRRRLHVVVENQRPAQRDTRVAAAVDWALTR